jgi:hypothetical protein
MLTVNLIHCLVHLFDILGITSIQRLLDHRLLCTGLLSKGLL